MKLLTKEQEAEHYSRTLQGGFIGGGAGLAIGGLGVAAASRRYQFFRQLTLPLKAFLVTSSATFGGIVTADHYSRAYEREQNPKDREYQARQRQQAAEAKAGKTFTERAMDFGRTERYKIVGASWIASMLVAFSLVNRNKYLTGQQKLVQARVYAQFLTVGVLVATAAFEISDRRNEEGRYETIRIVDPSDPEHKRMIEKRRAVDDGDAGDTLWKDMVAAEEERMKEREEEEKRMRGGKKQSSKKEGGDTTTNNKKKGKKEDKTDDNNNKDDGKQSGGGGSGQKSKDKDKDKDKSSSKKAE